MQVNSSIKTAGKVPQRTPEQACEYEAHRFAGSRRGQRLDKVDKRFAWRLAAMVGLDACVVDVPAGSGRFYDVFCNVKNLIMVDCDPNMLEAAHRKHGDAPNVKMIVGDIGSLPLQDNSADLCFCMRLFHHIETKELVQNVLAELARVSRKYVAFSFYNTNCWRYRQRTLRGKQPTGYYYSYQTIAALGKIAGLEVITKHPRFNLVEQQCLILMKKSAG